MRLARQARSMSALAGLCHLQVVFDVLGLIVQNLPEAT
jgi:hypothetical protein